MKIFFAALLAIVFITTAIGANYSTEATMSLQKDDGTYNVVVRVSELLEQSGKVTERMIAQPRIKSAPGVPASMYQGLPPTDRGYANKENVTVDVSWPYPNESGTALCAVVIKRGNVIVSKSKMQLKIEGPGRTPLVISPQQTNPQTAQVVENKGQFFLFIELPGKTREEIKQLANENYGNKVYIRDSGGRIVQGGISFGTYKETRLSVQYESKADAENASAILRGENQK